MRRYSLTGSKMVLSGEIRSIKDGGSRRILPTVSGHEGVYVFLIYCEDGSCGIAGHFGV
jgi:hypothetical protein